ncbi:MAG: hypothetical protein Q4F84_04550, partial [Fibrobacter sp.]|nr:hypothetical protein [Fibrobacter sp.]
MKKLFIITLLFSFSIYGRYSPALRLNTHLDQLVWRLSSSQNLEIPHTMLDQPVDYGEIYDFFSAVDSQKLSKQEKELLDGTMRYYNPEKGLIKWNNLQKDIHLRLYLELLGDIKGGVFDSSFARAKGIFRPTLTGNIKNFSFYTSIDVWSEYWSDSLFPASSYQPFDGVPYNLYGRETEYSHV